MNSNLITPDNYERLYEYYTTFVETSQWEKGNVMESVFKTGFRSSLSLLKFLNYHFESEVGSAFMMLPANWPNLLKKNMVRLPEINNG